jgi:biotin synthase
MPNTKVTAGVQFVLDKAMAGDEISREEAVLLMRTDEKSPDMYAIMSAANSLTRAKYGDRGEVYAQIGINLWPCSKSCAFCSFGEKWNIIKSKVEFSVDEVVARAKAFEEAGANAIFLMTTADYPFDRYVKIANAVREKISPSMPMVANIGDFEADKAQELVDMGFQAIYHVRRLREGRDTGIDPEKRLLTIKAATDAGLDLSYCVEPIGPEHDPKELVEEMFRGRQLGAVNLASMWRVPVPGLPLSAFGKISELSLAKAVAVTRIVAGDSIRAMGVHEPRILPMAAGANQIYAETGPNPRDTVEDTSEGRGLSVQACRKLLAEAGYTPLEGPTRVFRGRWA